MSDPDVIEIARNPDRSPEVGLCESIRNSCMHGKRKSFGGIVRSSVQLGTIEARKRVALWLLSDAR